MAIEVEKKFLLRANDKKTLTDGAQLVGTKTFTDTYYDNDFFDLTTHDLWLRNRDGRWELKIPLEHFQSDDLDQYRELETEEEITNYLKLSKDIPLSEAISSVGFKPCALITTTRTKYKKEGFIIDLDVLDYGYEIAEIEKMVSEESEIPKATEDILTFAKRHNLQTAQVRGKLIEYLKRNAPQHFNALVKAGIVTSEMTL